MLLFLAHVFRAISRTTQTGRLKSELHLTRLEVVWTKSDLLYSYGEKSG